MKVRGLSASFDRMLDEIERPKKQKQSPLMKAVRKGDLDEVRALLRAGADVDQRTPDEPGSLFHEGGRTALMMAAFEANVPIMAALLDAGADIEAVADDGDTALTIAAHADVDEEDCVAREKAVKFLLRRGAKLDPPRAKFTALYKAAACKNARLARFLIARGARVDAPIWTKTTPLMAAAREDADDVVTLLLARGASVAKRDENGQPPLLHAIEADSATVVRRLLTAGANSRWCDANGDSLLHHAARILDDPIDIVEALLTAGAVVDARGAHGQTPLLDACSMHNSGVAALLLDVGAKLEAADADGTTPLMHAARNGYVDLVDLLLRSGADATRRNRKGHTARALAKRGKRTDVLPLLSGEPPTTKRDLPLTTSLFTWTEAAQDSYENARYREACKRYARIPRAYRDNVFAIASNYAFALQQTGKHRAAAMQFDAAMALRPSSAQTARAACFSHYELEDWPGMLRCARVAVANAKNDSYAWQQLAIALQHTGDVAGAVDANRRALEASPKNAYAMANLGLALLEMGDDAWRATLQKAVKLKSSLASDPEVATALRGKPENRRARKRR